MAVGHHKLILLVDDNQPFRAAMAAMLEAESYTVVAANDGQDALDLLRGGLEPCLIILDLTMPRKDGAQFRTEQGQDPRLAAIPVVIVSGEDDGEAKAASLGVSSYLHKPTEAADLLALVACNSLKE